MLPASFLDRPIAHRAYHDIAAGRPENSVEAIIAAIEAGYGIEIDLQLSADGVAMVFHDYDLDRLTEETGPVRARSAAALGAIALKHGSRGIPTFAEVLTLVAGQVPLLVEVKDQDGAMGPDVGPLEAAAVQALRCYDGPVALMSFNPHSVAALAGWRPTSRAGSPPAPMRARMPGSCPRRGLPACAPSPISTAPVPASSATTGAT